MSGMASESHQVKLMGREFRIRSPEDPEHIDAAARYVNQLIEGMAGGKRHLPIQNVLLLASMSMADELLRERARHDALKEKIRAQSRALLARMDDRADAR